MVAGLIGQVLDGVPAKLAMIPMDFHLAILKPVPFVPLTVDVRIARQGKKLQVLQASLIADGAEVALATLVRLRDASDIAPANSVAPHSEPPPETLPRLAVAYPYFEFVDCRLIRGSFSELGSGASWMRVCGNIIAGDDNTSLGALAICADAGSGLGSLVSRSMWAYPNTSLTLHCHRCMMGDWILLDSVMHTQGHGVAQIHSSIADSSSRFGQVHQAVILEPLPAQQGVRPGPFG